jgi:hypothetical protein
MREQIEGERSGSQKEHPNPDRPMRKPVVDLIPLPYLAFVRILNPTGICHEGIVVLNQANLPTKQVKPFQSAMRQIRYTLINVRKSTHE